jgi:hypothetical protein
LAKGNLSGIPSFGVDQVNGLRGCYNWGRMGFVQDEDCTCGLERFRLIRGEEEVREKDVRRYADIEPVSANTVQTVWIVFKVEGL